MSRPARHRVVPDGCADVIVGAGHARAVGSADTAVVHELAAGSACFGLRLRPEAVAGFFGVPADRLTGLDLPLDDVVGSARARRLVDTVVAGRPDAALLDAPPEPVRRALALLAGRSVEGTADALGLSPRHLRRLVTSSTGLGPKAHQRVLRLRRFLAADGTLAEAAATAGYADQPHLTREVVRLCGTTPAVLRRERTG